MPPPTPDDFRSGPRVEAARVGNDMLEQINPRIRAIHHEEPDGPTECITLMSQDFKSLSWEAISNVPDVRPVAARGRPALGVRVPPARAPGAAERRRPRPLDAQEPAPRAQPRGADRGVPRRAARAPAPRPGRAVRVGVQPDQHAVGHVQRRRSPRRTSPSTGSAMLEESIRRIDAFRAAHPEHPIVDVQYDDLVARSGRARSSRSTPRSATRCRRLDADAHGDAMTAVRRRAPEGRPRRARLRPRRVRPRRRRSSPSASPATSIATTCPTRAGR